MVSQFSAIGPHMHNSKTINLVVVAHGDIQTVHQLLLYVKQQLAKHLKPLPIVYYSDRTLDQAEGEPHLLQSKRNPSLRVSRNSFLREYIGFTNCYGLDELYNRLYLSSGPSEYTVNYSYYTPNELSKILHKYFNSEENETGKTFGDLVINLKHTVLDFGQSYAYISYQINEELIRDNIHSYLNWSHSLIASLDSSFSNVFQSAYISLNYPDVPITHTRVYNEYDFSLCNRYLLGAEWYIYLGKSISEYLCGDVRDRIAPFASVKELQNGLTCTANGSVFSFNDVLRTKISHIFKDLLIPSFSVYNWSDLHNLEWNVNYMPQVINVYHDPYAKHNPTVVFSFHCNIDEITDLKGIDKSKLLNTFVLKKQ